MSAVDRQELAAQLAGAIRCRTLTEPDGTPVDPGQFEAFHALLRAQFPAAFEVCEVHVVQQFALLLRWPGRSAVDPVLLMAHQDVVPAQEQDWSVPPFEGRVDDGRVWGRGALDDKGSLVAILSAVHDLAAGGFTPARDVYLFFGCNEESAGTSAVEAAQWFAARGMRLWLVLDEGGAVAHEAFPGVAAPAAVFGVSEKGVLDLELEVAGTAGHASMPPRDDAPGRLARALVRLDAARPAPRLLPTTITMVRELARQARPPMRLALSGLSRSPLLLARVFDRLGPETAAMTRTTTAVTTLSGAAGQNVLAERATAHLNVRVQPGDSVAATVGRVRRAVRDRRVTVRVVHGSEPSPVSPSDGAQWQLLVEVTEATFPDAISVPYITMMATDARHLTSVSDHVYRFTPIRMDRAGRAAIHGVDERVGIDALVSAQRWYRDFLRALPEGSVVDDLALKHR